MRTPCKPQMRPEKPYIVIIDSRKLRQASMVRLLETWAEAMGLTVRAIDSISSIERLTPCEMVILSVGSASVEDHQQQTLIKSTRKLLPRARLVIFSDREEPKEVCSAFEGGAAGFMPTSIDPSVALQALSFIKCGGSFFPPSALHREAPSAATHEAPDRTQSRLRLSAKQQKVLQLLRQGQSNKLIASQLGLSEATVKVHLRCLMRKLGAANRTQVANASMNLN